ncbi:hypothetical protein [Oceanospirillum sp.]|uniref:hypothetical protein n=1 Tax=Oceanospirillum sp. TaxID=2021254 RepID=UPI003A9147BF
MAFESYQFLSWSIYLLSALAVMIVTLRITRSWPLTLRGFIVTTATVLFAVPWYVQGTGGPLAPAVIITFFETFGGVEGATWMRAGLPLLGGLAVGYLVLALFLWLKSRQGESGAASSGEATEER